MLNVTKNNLCLAVFSLFCNLKPSKVYSWLKPPVVWLILLGYWLVIAEFMYLERYGLRTIEYKMKLAGTPQWAIGIQYSQAWIGFNVTGFTIIPNNIQPSVSFFVNINLADKNQRRFLYEFINIEVYLFKMWGFLLSSVLHHWTETYSNILTSVCGFGNCWELGIGLGKSANTDLPVLQQSLYCLFAWNWNLVHSFLIGLEVLWRLNF